LDRLHYACKDGEGFENVGLRQTDNEIARTIRALESEYKIKVKWRVAGPDIFNPKRSRDGMMGPSPSEEMSRVGVHFIKADDARVIVGNKYTTDCKWMKVGNRGYLPGGTCIIFGGQCSITARP